MKTIQQLEAERFAWSVSTFGDATPISSLRKLEGEIKEVENEILYGTSQKELTEELADCLMCLFDCAGRVGISPDEIFKAFKMKLEKNKSRVWKKNPDNSYSHIKN